jgi:nucleotide-binding universal stress UspA family protein
MPLADVKTRLAFKNILFTTDFSDASRNALPVALAIARRYQSNIYIANVIEEVPVTSVPMDTMPSDTERDRKHAEKRMNEFLKFNSFLDIKSEIILEPGFVWSVVQKIVEDHKIDMVVLGTHGRGTISRLFMGSIAEQIFRHATCPVMTIGPHVKPTLGQYDRVERILFATDFSAGSSHALQYALSFAEERDARLILLHVVQPPGVPVDITEQLLSESEVKLRSLMPAEAMPVKRPVFVSLIGAPADMILKLADSEQIDLIVMGMHKPRAFANHWPFEVAGRVIANTFCPVLSVRA